MKVPIILVNLLGMLCICAGDIPDHFIVSGSDLYQGKDFQVQQERIGDIQGVWHFGESESEWSVAIIPHNAGMVVQSSNSFFSDKAQNFLSIDTTLNSQKIENGIFKIAKPNRVNGYYKARLIESKEVDRKTGKKTRMLLLDGNSLDSRKGAHREAGIFSGTLKEYFGDQYLLSCTVLSESVLKKKKATELALMRNEIFARYGMIFSDPVIKKHFLQKDWYRPWRADVMDSITEIEWTNIRNIRKQEEMSDRK